MSRFRLAAAACSAAVALSALASIAAWTAAPKPSIEQVRSAAVELVGKEAADARAVDLLALDDMGTGPREARLSFSQNLVLDGSAIRAIEARARSFGWRTEVAEYDGYGGGTVIKATRGHLQAHLLDRQLDLAFAIPLWVNGAVLGGALLGGVGGSRVSRRRQLRGEASSTRRRRLAISAAMMPLTIPLTFALPFNVVARDPRAIGADFGTLVLGLLLYLGPVLIFAGAAVGVAVWRTSAAATEPTDRPPSGPRHTAERAA